MKALIQRVNKAQVLIDGKIVGKIGKGMVVFLGVGKNDNSLDIDFMVRKIPQLRIFDDVQGKMNICLKEIQGEILLISQFTLYGNCRRGLRPSYDEAAAPLEAKKLYDQVAQNLRDQNITIAEGVFGAMMQVELSNDGPVTILLDSKERRKA
ncbi:D-aminoacyl-tRNA deacylase [Atribacter laminatus]|uniref:D-aminoacyl-tRNA deacylase n=1 Tax=Atribacter laminatus TaxID=2847778 RepID=A0A7T1AMQ7_ATRLM|nr:D-aminoacyl-tRNA deacylase [Atribacter laminatus]QPM68739.1 D-aminoacyl-tRNA deacylase [Atribacter laminatus]